MLSYTIFQEEQNRLQQVIREIKKMIEDSQENLNKQEKNKIGFTEGMRGTQFTRQSLMSFYATEKEQLERALSNPYFGRFELKLSSNDETEIIYIGKKGIVGRSGEIIASDWRSPICSMYYEYDIGPAEYSLNGSNIKTEILKKRQITIASGQLKSVTEYNTISDDSFLINCLNENSDGRSRNIVSTIQREQNRIIRSPLNHNYIVQGVAGSGKTVIALHRIAYLLYNNAKELSEKSFIIIGPNTYFLNFISELLPDLDIVNISQTTFNKIVLEALKLKLKIESKNETLKRVLSREIDISIIEYKKSLDYMNRIALFIKEYIISHLQEPIVYGGIEICSVERLKAIYDESRWHSGKSYFEIINEFINLIIKEIKERADTLCSQVWSNYREEFLSLDKNSPRRKEILNISNQIENEIRKKGCSSIIRKYFKFATVSSLNLYIAFLENIERLIPNSSIDIDELKRYSLPRLKKKQISAEDLAPLLYIEYLINNLKQYKNISHIVIDEAQDLSFAEFFVLKRLFSSAYFDIYGDVNQSIYDYQLTNNWKSLISLFPPDSVTLFDLNRSYRTTRQISNTSNLILTFLNQKTTECVSRKGEDLTITDTSNMKDIDQIIFQLYELLRAQYKTIAIICKDDTETKKVYNLLKNNEIDINIVTEQDESYKEGIIVLSSYLSKGLEFDAVIIFNANNINYGDNCIDQRLLYIAITRAMHRLYINYNGQITSSLRSIEAKLSNKILVRDDNK